MAHVGLDLFDFAGKKHLICVDKWSGFPLYKRLNSTTTQSIINVLETWFNTLGWPSNIRSDGGPQFLGPFRQWCQKNNIVHELSAPYNPKSNGLAEAAVKNVKLLLSKCSVTKEDPQRALYYWRNIPRKDGYSPAQLLMGRKQFTQLPAAPVHYEFYDPASAQVSKDKAFDAAQKAHDQHASFFLVSARSIQFVRLPTIEGWVGERAQRSS